ncbi:MAG TPA: hypothetical protein VN956_27420 [Pyrinomonadaceae bacterium]|nr:hypothetical protein [Pyrinomonadaceae bacterium]
MQEAKNNLIQHAAELWQPRAGDTLSDEDARKMADNIAGFFTVLSQWEAGEKERQDTESDDSYYAKSA